MAVGPVGFQVYLRLRVSYFRVKLGFCGFRVLLRFGLRETADGSFLELTSRFSYVAPLQQVGLSAGCDSQGPNPKP